jgi:hypothetical protein
MFVETLAAFSGSSGPPCRSGAMWRTSACRRGRHKHAAPLGPGLCAYNSTNIRPRWGRGVFAREILRT